MRRRRRRHTRRTPPNERHPAVEARRGAGLKRTLGPVMLWGLGVGYVISGEYFGWNLGAILSGRTAEIITLACFGALSLYILAMISLFALRKNEPELERPFRAVLYPISPAIALVIATVSFAAMTWFNPVVAGVFFGLVGLGALYFVVAGRRRKAVAP